MALPSKPDFKLTSPNPNPGKIPDALWWFWLMFDKHIHPATLLGGIYANKSGFHNTGSANASTNYSLSPASKNKSGPWWSSKASAVDLTFPDAQAGNFASIAKYSKRLLDASKAKDERLTKYLHEWYGNADTDREVEGWSLNKGTAASSDNSHLWHIHLSFYRVACGDFWAAWAVLTVLDGWTVAQWKASLPAVAGAGGGTMAEVTSITTAAANTIATRVWGASFGSETAGGRLAEITLAVRALLGASNGDSADEVIAAVRDEAEKIKSQAVSLAEAEAARDAAEAQRSDELLSYVRNLAAGGATADEIVDKLSERLSNG